MIKPILFPYKMGSTSARLLAHELGALRVFPDRNYRPRSNHVVINWGNSTLPSWWGRAHLAADFINIPQSVELATNKIKAFDAMLLEGVNIPEYTTDKQIAKSWDGIVVCRKTVTGHEGRGIVIANTPSEIVDAPLYTKHLRHKHEYRVHVFKGSVIDFTQKKKRAGSETTSSLVRNSANNWVFCREGVTLPDDAKEQAIKAVDALFLDFGAVDIAYRERDNKAYVLEVNTAPGIEGTTLNSYSAAIKEYLNGL